MIKRELPIFIVVGLLTVLVDFVFYRGFVLLDLADVDIAKALGFVAGTIFAYFANKLWTFNHKEHAPGSAWKFAILYACTLIVNVLVNALVLNALSQVTGGIQIAFLIATAVSASLNFLGMKFLVFKSAATSGIL